MKAFTVTTVTTLLYQQLVLSVLFHLVDNQSSVVNAEHLRPEKDNDSSGRKLSGLGIIKNSIKDIEVLESEERNIEETLKQKLSESGELEDLKGDLYELLDNDKCKSFNDRQNENTQLILRINPEELKNLMCSDTNREMIKMKEQELIEEVMALSKSGSENEMTCEDAAGLLLIFEEADTLHDIEDDKEACIKQVESTTNDGNNNKHRKLGFFTSVFTSLVINSIVGLATQDPNICLLENNPKRRVSQSGTGWGGVAERAVDGNTNGYWWEGSTTHTDWQSQPRWAIHFGQEAELNEVNIWNRRDCCMALNDGLKLQLVRFNGSWYDVVKEFTIETASRVNTFNFGDAKGHSLRISKKNAGYLSLAEVEVRGKLLGKYGLNGEQVCEGHGYNYADCNNIGCCHYSGNDCWSSVGQNECFV